MLFSYQITLCRQLIPLPKSENQQDDQPPTKKLKVEQVDEDVIPEQPKQKANVDVDALTVGVSVDADDATKEAQPKKQRPAVIEERQKIIQFKVVKNDPSLPEEEQTQNLIILAGLKAIFQKQLPKMPREYIARLVYDRNHRSMAIVKEGLQVRGGITWRPFESRAFSEIVFCAITGTEQVKVSRNHLLFYFC